MGVLKLEVQKPLGESMVTRILDSVENAAASKPKIDRFITRFARIYTPVVVFAAILTAVIPSLITGNWNYWIYTAITFLVISCPCALVLSVPLAFFSGIGAGSRQGILFKGGIAIEDTTYTLSISPEYGALIGIDVYSIKPTIITKDGKKDNTDMIFANNPMTFSKNKEWAFTPFSYL